MTSFLRLVLLIAALGLAVSGAPGMALAQETPDGRENALGDTDPDPALSDIGEVGGPAANSGGNQTLEDILRRQRGEVELPSNRPYVPQQDGFDPAATGPLGAMGGASDPELWRAMRYNAADVTASNDGPAATVLMQDSGMRWLEFRRGPLLEWGGWGLVAVLGLLAVFLLLRGRIRIDGPKTGVRIERFKGVERFAHWLLATSFVILGLTGLLTLFGRKFLIPAFGREAFATAAQASKWLHNSVAWAFMLALVLVFVMWVIHNIPNRHDLKWLAMGGGIFTKGHPPAKKFNAGQKLIFWAVIVLGLSISASGISLLFPFELPMFAKTFGIVNQTPLPEWLGWGPLPVELAPHQEMQLSQAWHAIVAFVFIAIIFAHIYLGSVGMEGAFDAMGKGHVELQWAREHHNLWVEELEQKGKAPAGPAHGSATGAHPAE